MLIRVCKSKIHHATVTRAELDYVGSITIDRALLVAADIRPYQYVNVTNLSNGVFWQTYVVAAPAGSGRIELNGPPARHFQPGDRIIILAEAYVEPAEIRNLRPRIVVLERARGAKTLAARNRKFHLIEHREVRDPRRRSRSRAD